MLFNSFPFLLVFLPLVLALSRQLRGQALLRFLALASFIFYAFAGHVWFVIPMLATTCLDFFMAPRIAQERDVRKRKWLLMVSVTANLGLLFYFKYATLALHSVGVVSQWLSAQLGLADPHFTFTALQVILPAGISFYTFQTLSYIIDIYRGDAKPERNFWRFACFVSFFPHLVAGPLTRHDQLIPQLRHIEKSGLTSRWQEGIYLFTIGLAKKVLIGDRIAPLIHPLIGDAEHMTMVTAWLALLGFTLQIYFDFSGYSDMAIGLGRLFGIELPQNFNQPYQARSPADFWRRWHITLSLWLRDYLYIPLGGNRCSSARRNANLLITMLLGGLWHGAHWTFALWGMYHGLLLILYHRFQQPWDKMHIVLQRVATFLLVSVGWLFFRAPSLREAWLWLIRLGDISHIHTPLLETELRLIAWIVLGLVITQALPVASSYSRFHALSARSQFVLGMMAFCSILALNYSSRFLYFQF